MAEIRLYADRDLDCGTFGLDHHFQTADSIFREVFKGLLLVVGLWIIFVRLPPTFDLRLSQDLTVFRILLVALGIFTLKVSGRFATGIWCAIKWLRLEAIGPQWIRLNDHDLRLTFYRVADGSYQYDKKTREERVKDEVWCQHARRQNFSLVAWRIGFIGAAVYALPYAIDFACAQVGPGIGQFLEDWHVTELIQWYLLFVQMGPWVAMLLTYTLYEIAYQAGAQYISGAKVKDPIIYPKTVETMREEQVHGSATFIHPAEAARKLADDE